MKRYESKACKRRGCGENSVRVKGRRGWNGTKGEEVGHRELKVRAKMATVRVDEPRCGIRWMAGTINKIRECVLELEIQWGHSASE